MKDGDMILIYGEGNSTTIILFETTEGRPKTFVENMYSGRLANRIVQQIQKQTGLRAVLRDETSKYRRYEFKEG